MKTRISLLLITLFIFSVSLPALAAEELVVNGTFSTGTPATPPTGGDDQPAGWTGFVSNDAAWDGVTSTPGFYAGHPTASPDSGGQNYGDASDSSSTITATLTQTLPPGFKEATRNLTLSYNLYAGTTNGGVTVTLRQGGTTWSPGQTQGGFPGGAPAWTPFSYAVPEDVVFDCLEPIDIEVAMTHSTFSPNPFGNIHGYWIDDISLFERGICSTPPVSAKAVPTLPQWTLILLSMLLMLVGVYGVRIMRS